MTLPALDLSLQFGSFPARQRTGRCCARRA